MGGNDGQSRGKGQSYESGFGSIVVAGSSKFGSSSDFSKNSRVESHHIFLESSYSEYLGHIFQQLSTFKCGYVGEYAEYVERFFLAK